MIGCMSNELLDKERTFPYTRAISEAMRQHCTRRLRTDYTFFSEIILLSVIYHEINGACS